MRSFIFAVCLFAATVLQGQPLTERYAAFGDVIVTQLPTAPFPHPLRANGYTYSGKKFSADEHYMDSTVALFVPKDYRRSKTVDLVVYFHGWSNNVDTALHRFALIEQFCASRKNAVFVFPEGPRNAPDSFGGRLEEKDGFKKFIADVMGVLKKEQKIPAAARVGRIVIAGHSGAYRVMSFILMRGGLTPHVKEVYLFDALYGQTEKFAYWIDHTRGRMVNIYTNEGGTKNESENLMACLDGWKKPFFAADELKATPEDLRRHALIFLHSDLEHNDVVAKRNQFSTFLATSQLSFCRPAKSVGEGTDTSRSLSMPSPMP